MGHRNTVFFAFCYMLLLPISPPAPTPAPPPIPAIFAFGDSTVDPGNNNKEILQRKTSTDYIASALGIKELLPAYLDSTISDDDFLSGVSFGSAGTGLDELTVNLSNVLDMWAQLDYFDKAKTRVQKHVVGERMAGEIVKNALFVINVGTNDLLYDLYLVPTRMLQFSIFGSYNFC